MEDNNLSRISLIASNILPLIGVIFWEWNVASIILLYWSENLIIGLFNVIKMWKAEGSLNYDIQSNMKFSFKDLYYKIAHDKYGKYAKLILIIFFIIHYGFFTLIQGLFVFSSFKIDYGLSTIILLSFLSIFISHLVSYKVNFIGKNEYLNISSLNLFTQPYNRVVVMQITIIFGGFLVVFLGQPIWALIIMVFMKTLLDLKAHNKEHHKFKLFINVK